MAPDETIDQIIDYPLAKDGSLVTRRSGLTRMKPKLNAPKETQPGSVDWTMTMLFGSRQKALEMIESLVAGQGENADEKWIRVILLYKQWQIQFAKGELEEPPTLNQVCYSLNFDAGQFIGELQMGIQSLMTKVAHIKASMAVPEIMNRVVERATAEEADVKERELGLRIAGVIDEKGGVNVQINNTNQTAVMTKGERDLMKSPLRQFSNTVIDIDDEVRKERDDNQTT